MVGPQSAGQFYVETTRQTMKDAASAQDASRRYLDEFAHVSRDYYASLAAVQLSALQTAFQLQNSAVQASEKTIDTAIKAGTALFDEWARVIVDSQAAVTRLTTASMALIADYVPAGRN